MVGRGRGSNLMNNVYSFPKVERRRVQINHPQIGRRVGEAVGECNGYFANLMRQDEEVSLKDQIGIFVTLALAVVLTGAILTI